MSDDTSTSGTQIDRVSVERGGCLSAYLVFMIGANALSAAAYFLNPEPVLQQFPRLTPGLVALLGAGGALNVLLAVLVWRWRRIGVFGFLGVALVAFALNLYMGVPTAMLAIGVAGPALLAVLVRGRWQHFS